MLNSGAVLQNRYHILRQLGGGGMGKVYLAEDRRLIGRRCAVKEFSPTQLALADRNWAIQAFEQEAQLLASLSHPGLTAVTDFFPEGGNWYLVMEYVEGGTLADYIARAGGRLPPQEALRVTRQLFEVLEFLHARQPPIIFRDLKPENVMFTPAGNVKLIDFGIARFFKAGQTRDTINLGTPGYAAPEQYGGLGQSDPRTDVYSLGVLLNRMLTGYDPITAVTPFPIPDPRTITRDISPHIAEVIVRATQGSPDARYPSMEQMRRALFPPTHPLPPEQRIPTGTRAMSSTRMLPESATARSRTGLWLGLGLAGLALLLCSVVVGGLIASGVIPLGAPPTASGVTAPRATTVASTPTATPPPTRAPETSAPTLTSAPPAQPTPPPTTAPTDSAERWLLYVRGNVGATDIYVANAEGHWASCVACKTCDEAEPAWSPDARHIVYQSDCSGNYDIWRVERTGGNATQLTRTSAYDEREPNWSPDGQLLVYRRNAAGAGRNADGDLWVMDSSGSNARSLGLSGRAPVWSPDGERIAFMSERGGGWDIYVYTVQTRATSALTRCTPNCRWPAWSPAGDYLVFHSTTGASSTTAETIWTLPLDGGDARQIVTGAHAGRPSWSNSGWIAFNSDNGIESISAQGTGRRVLISGDEHWAPRWSP